MKVTTLKGIFPDPKPVRRKNFIHENVKNLRRMEQCLHANREIEELQKLQLHKHRRAEDKYQNISARVVTSFREKKKHENDNTEIGSKNNVNLVLNDETEDGEQKSQNESNIVENKKHITITKKAVKQRVDNNTLDRQKKRDSTCKHKSQQKLKVSSEPNVSHKCNVPNDENAHRIVKYRSQAIQTLDTDETESIYSEGIIRYPTKKITKPNEVTTDIEDEKVSKKQSDPPLDRGDMHTPENVQKLDLQNSVSSVSGEVDFIKLNKEHISVANKLTMQLNNGVPPPNYRKGIVPKYLRERKEAQQKEQKAIAEASHPDCPEGHVPIPDNERKETLRLLKKNYQDYVNELNMMPIKTDTLRAQRRKMEIEKQLNKLEEGIKVFSRPKVYVKINA